VLAAKGPRSSAPANPPVVVPPDASSIVADAIDVPVDGVGVIAVDAAEPTTLLEIHTKPAGAMVKIGNQSRTAPAKFALAAGHYTLLAELDGWIAERREIDLIERDHLVQEVVFSRRTGGAKGPPPPQQEQKGTLTVRTNPYAEVYINGKKIGETPFADVQLPAGTYMVVFKNPSLPPVKKVVTISPGKPVKLNFDLKSP